MKFDELVESISTAATNLENGTEDYLPMPDGLGEISKSWFRGRIRGQLTCITGGTSSGKTSLYKYIIFETIRWAIKRKKNYKVLLFLLEESVEEFEYSLLSYLLFRAKKRRYNIEHFLGIGKSVKKEHLEELKELSKTFELFRSYFIIEDGIYNTFGIWKSIRAYARNNGKFLFRGKELTQEQLDAGEKWTSYVPNDPNSHVEVVVDHISEIVKQSGQATEADAMADCVRDMRTLAAKKLRYYVFIIQQQMLQMESLEHIKESMMYASIQGLGDNKRLARAYHNMIGITDPNRYGLKIATTNTGNYKIDQLGSYQRVIGILKKRFGISNRRDIAFFDGCCGIFGNMPKPDANEYKELLNLIKEYESEISQ